MELILVVMGVVSCRSLLYLTLEDQRIVDGQCPNRFRIFGHTSEEEMVVEPTIKSELCKTKNDDVRVTQPLVCCYEPVVAFAKYWMFREIECTLTTSIETFSWTIFTSKKNQTLKNVKYQNYRFHFRLFYCDDTKQQQNSRMKKSTVRNIKRVEPFQTFTCKQ